MRELPFHAAVPVLAALAVLAASPCQVLGAAGDGPAQAAHGEGARSSPPAPVQFDGKVLFVVRGEIAGLTPQMRAARIEERLRALAGAREAPGTVRVVEGPESDLFAGDEFIASVTDAESGGRQNRALYAANIARVVQGALDAYRSERTPEALARAAVRVGIATAVLLLLLVVLRLVHRRVGPALGRRVEAILAATRFERLGLFSRESVHRGVERVGQGVRVVLLLVVLLAWVQVVLHFLPWTRGAADRWLGFVLGAAREVLRGVVGFLPNVVYIVLFGIVGYGANQLNKLFFRAVTRGLVRLPGFHPEWGPVTGRIASLFVFALVGVAIYPYLPGSGSSAFQAIGIFLGAVISLGSGSSVSNAISGVVITYMSPFAVGDFVKVGDATGTVTEHTSLAVRIRTIRNEQVVIPAAIALANPIVNYSQRARSEGLAIRTCVSIGYDTPWRTVHELLLAAASRTAGVLRHPAPWVIQTELHDFYVKYELDAYVDAPDRQHFVLSELNQNVLDAFAAAGVEILSPHYAALRDGNATALPPGHGPTQGPERAFHVAPAGTPRGGTEG